jgi:signal transduction histidine kinase
MKTYAIAARVFAGCGIITAWGLTVQPLSGVAFLLILTALSAIRYRFAPYTWLAPVEVALCVAYAFFWFPAMLGLWFPAIGLLEIRWQIREEELLRLGRQNRSERLRLEREREGAASKASNAARLAEINERARIAQGIHDHAGHEITGALIALQTALELGAADSERARPLLTQTVTRLESASVTLRETIYNLKPTVIGSESLESLCDTFTFCEIDFSQSAEPTLHGELLAANLKEALSNISRHSTATLVQVRVNENADYIRMTIADNGRRASGRELDFPVKLGLGLGGMKERVRRAGGTLTISTDNGFKITQILPKAREEHRNG